MGTPGYAGANMCGIGGILRVWPVEQRDRALRTPHAQSIPEAWLDILDESIRHRGPDGQGRFRDRAIRADGSVVDVAFVHRRLSIIDHAGGAQPMVWVDGGPARRDGGPSRLLRPSEIGESCAQEDAGSESRPTSDRIAVVFNGCIYNHRELRAELQHAGHAFSTDHSDTEVLVHGWREWGGGLFDRLDGMYALAIWDSGAGGCVLARDAFGEKPLYQISDGSNGQGCFAFASTVVGLLRLERTLLGDPSPDGEEPGAWLRPWIKFGWNQGVTPRKRVREVIGGVRQALPPRGAAAADDHLGWAPVVDECLNPSHRPLAPDETDTLLRHAVGSRLEADVPLGCFLSGGLDSAVITAMARLVRPEIRAFTVRMPDASYDESGLAAATARAIGVNHSVLDCDPHPAADLEGLISQLGLPFGDSSLLPTHWVSRAACREVKVALAGDGGDEMFLGYDRHRAIPWLSRLARLPGETLEALAGGLPVGVAGGRRSRRDRLARLMNAAAADGYKELVAIFPAPLDAQLGIARGDRSGFGRMPHFGMTQPGDDPEFLWRIATRFDRLFYLPCDLMRKTDTASMAVGLEVRSPMLQVDLARATINAPVSSLMPRGQRKGLLRRVARRYLPGEIVDRPKMGFAIPIGDWFRTDYGGLRTMLLDHLGSVEPFGPPGLGIDLNMKFVRRMLDEHLGTGPSGLVRRDHSQRLYMLLVLSIWAKWLARL